MRRLNSSNSMSGVTLLEIMLVLAIAAVITLLSVRYYQQATTSSKVTQTLTIINGVAVAGESFLSAHGTYVGLGAALATYMGGKTPTSAWGGEVTVTKDTATGYLITIPNVPVTGACPQIKASIEGNSNFTVSCAAAAMTVTVGPAT